MTSLQKYLTGLQRFGIRPGLERIRALLDLAGHPERQYPHLLVGGTNGKGSTCEFLARTLAHSGKKVGLFTSPHLYQWNERIRILPGSGHFEGAIEDESLDSIFHDAISLINEVRKDFGQPTEFELMTFLGLWHFARSGVDAAVVEVGLGGKWDATNATDPLVSVITHVDLDHCDRLGDTHVAIASDKVHIARPGRPLVTCETREDVLQVFGDYCGEIGARLVRVPQEGLTRKSHSRHPAFQEENWATAEAAGQEFCRALGWEWPRDFRPDLEVNGRFQRIGLFPSLYIDGANNPDGAQHLAQAVHGAGISRDQLIVVLGILADKDFEAMAASLSALGHTVIATQSTSPRAASAQDVAVAAAPSGAHIEVVPSVPAAVERARQLAGPQGTVLVTGSFTTIAEVPRA